GRERRAPAVRASPARGARIHRRRDHDVDSRVHRRRSHALVHRSRLRRSGRELGHDAPRGRASARLCRFPVAAQSRCRDVCGRPRTERRVAGPWDRRRISAMKLSGVFAPIPTPFDERDEVDTRRLTSVLKKLIARPLDGFVILGSNGEAVLMDDFEADRVIVAARDTVPSDRVFIVGTGREATRAAIKASKRAAEHGADAVLVRTPGFFKNQMTTDAFVRHYTALADESPVPVLLYNFTALTGVNLLPAAVHALATHPNIVGMKESGGDVAQIADLVSGTSKDFAVLAGTTATFYAALCVGVSGGVLALGCVVPDACKRLFTRVREGRHDAARALQRDLMPLARLLGPTYGVPGLKAAMNLLGYDVGVPRPPLSPVPPAAVSALREALAPFQEVTA